ncbi:MFS transporter [Anaerosolibacter sp.]|uniref:MFS transporter n=1 Tax=Anaerosolibacter sp. TaxID=1872527 RepID=UPI0039F060F8
MHEEEHIQPTPIKTSFFYGWIIVAIGALGLFFTGPGQTFFVSIFINSYIENFGWSRSMVSSFYSIATLVAGLILPMVGRWTDRIGHRKSITIIAVLLGVACIWMSAVMNPIMLFIGFLLIRLLGQGSMNLIPYVLVPQWFIRKRGIALSIMSVGIVVSSGFLPPINSYLIRHIGVSYTWMIWAGLLIGMMAPLGWKFTVNQPEDIGLLPDGDKVELKNETGGNIEVREVERSWTLKQATATRAFWLMLFCTAIPSLINTGITFHMVSILETKGFTPDFAAYVLSITAMVQFPLTFVAGYLLDRMKVHRVIAVNFWVLITAMLIILYGKSSSILILYAVLHGTFNVFNSVSSGVLWSNYYGRKHLGSIRGITMTWTVVGSSLGPLPFGFAYDLFHGYGEIIMIMMILPILGSIASFMSPAPKWKKQLES